MRSSVPSAVHLSMTTAVWPRCMALTAKFDGAAWYSGPAHRCTPGPGATSNSRADSAPAAAVASASATVGGRRHLAERRLLPVVLDDGDAVGIGARPVPEARLRCDGSVSHEDGDGSFRKRWLNCGGTSTAATRAPST